MTTQHMTRDEQFHAVLSAPVPICPNCGHGMDPHSLNPGDICGVGGCPCLLTPSAIHHLLTSLEHRIIHEEGENA